MLYSACSSKIGQTFDTLTFCGDGMVQINNIYLITKQLFMIQAYSQRGIR